MTRKALAIIMSFAILIAVCIPGTYAVEAATQSVLICEKTEHIHGPECYTKASEPQCGLVESSGHTHDSSCYVEQQTLTCQLAEDDTHTHSDGCYTSEKILTCELPITEGHVHSDTCYPNELTCTFEEHQHSTECYEVTQPAVSDSTSIPDNTVTTQPTDFPATSQPTCTCGSFEGIHATTCPLYVEVVNGTNKGTMNPLNSIDNNTDTKPVDYRVITNGSITVSGNIPKNVSLNVATSLNSIGSKDPLANLDITLTEPNGKEWQPLAGQFVTVSIDGAPYDLKNGHDYVIYHVHKDTSGNETVTSFIAVPQNGKMTFDLPGFSEIVIKDAELQLLGVSAFYPSKLDGQEAPSSINDQWGILGVYYTKNSDGQYDTHILMGHTTNNLAVQQLGTFYVNQIPVSLGASDVTIVNDSFTTITAFSDLEGTEPITDLQNKFAPLINKKPFNGYIDINIGQQVPISDYFTIGMESGAGGYSIGEIPVYLQTDFSITKEVMLGTDISKTFTDNIEAYQGDEITYRIQIDNQSYMPIIGLKVSDVLPENLFIPETVKISYDNGITWENFDSTNPIKEVATAGTFTDTFYIKAQIRTDAAISPIDDAIGNYVNTVSATANNMPILSDNASIKVNPPILRDLVIRKEGAENIDEDQSFIFRISGQGIVLRVVIIGNDSITIKDLPKGIYSVSEETDWSWRYPKEGGYTQSVDLTDMNGTVTFTNVRSIGQWLNGAAHKINNFLLINN